MNRYPLWKYLVIVVALLIGLVYTLPNFYGESPAVQVSSGKATVKVLNSTDQWYGVTYREDKPVVVAGIAQKTAEGLYPENLWGEGSRKAVAGARSD